MANPRMRICIWAMGGILLAWQALAQTPTYSEQDLSFIESHGPWPPLNTPDPSNRVSGNGAAMELGRHLFFDPDLSKDGIMSCASCHVPESALTDGLPTGSGRAPLRRNTPALFNLAFARWFGWGGGADSLWAQSIRPILDPQEMASTAESVRSVMSANKGLSCLYEKAFGSPVENHTTETGLVNAAKALAAYQETFVTAKTPFDHFRDALIEGNREQGGSYPLAAQRGLKIFVGKGQCSLCHFGPQFTNNEFGDIGIPFFAGKGIIDKGRYGGIQKLKTSPYSLQGPHSDDQTKTTATKTSHLFLQDRNFGEFKIPSLRNVAETAPYMHNGSLATLEDVVRHYSEIDEERLHVDGEKILKPLHLTSREQADLVAFLKSLSAPLQTPLRKPVGEPTCSTN